MQPAVDYLLKKRNKDGTLNINEKYTGQTHFDMEKAGKPSRWNTLRALRVFKYFRIDNHPFVIIVLGLPGSGKSYFAERLAKSLHVEYVNSDRLRKELFPKRMYSEEEKQKVYDAMIKKMKETVGQGKNLVLDATFHKKTIRNAFSKKAKGQIHFIEVWAAEEIIKERLKNNRPYSEANFEVYLLIKQEWEPLEHDHLRLESTNDNIDEMLQKAIKFLKDDSKPNR